LIIYRANEAYKVGSENALIQEVYPINANSRA